jgi:uncharacterized protein YdhG (YjbR/CyaY superfamily)
MKAESAVPKDIDDYIAGFPAEVRELLEQMRAAIKKAAPQAEEKISYRMPAFFLNGNLIYFAAFKNHIGLYPGAGAVESFKQELSVYRGAKGSVQLPLDKPIPSDLIERIVKFRIEENRKRAEAKGKKKKK